MAKPIKKQRWSNIDVFGLIAGEGIWDSQSRNLLYVRRPFDTTLDMRDKVLRSNAYKAGVTKQGLINGLSNEFGYTPHNVTSKTHFRLTRDPMTSGALGVQDVIVEYRPVGYSGSWTSIFPQVWGSGYLQAKEEKRGFILWPFESFANISEYKNFNYSRDLEIMEDLDDRQEIRITYWISSVDSDNRRTLVRFTDLDNYMNPDDQRFRYRKPVDISLLNGVVAYNLNDIPSGLVDRYYDEEGIPLEPMYTIKSHIDKKFKHTWAQMSDNSVIWDVHRGYGSGQIGHFLDAAVAKNDLYCIRRAKVSGLFFSGYRGGVEELSNALYFSEFEDQDDSANSWYFKLYPGRFYLAGIPYYMFEDPVVSGLVFTNGVADIPSGLTRGMYTILAKSGYYENPCTTPDEYLSGFVYEDYWYPTGKNGDSEWGDIYRRRPRLVTSWGYDLKLELGQYAIDFLSGKIYCNCLESGATIIWDRQLVPSGRLIQYDLNPLNDEYLNLQKFFLYMSIKES